MGLNARDLHALQPPMMAIRAPGRPLGGHAGSSLAGPVRRACGVGGMRTAVAAGTVASLRPLPVAP